MMVSRTVLEEMALMAMEILGPDRDNKEVINLTHYTIRKWDLTGKDEDYLLLLYEDELKDYLRRKAINEIGRENYERNLQST